MSRPKRRTRKADQAPVSVPTLVNSKLEPPRLTAVSVERKPLLARIDRALVKGLVLMVAPIGSGKTTLLAQWYDHAAGDRTIAWLSLDERDNEPTRFFSYLVGAIRATVKDFDAYIASRFNDRVQPPIEHMVDVFVESLGRIERDLIVVLDDFQWIADAAVTRAFLYLLRRAPANVRWIIASRRLPEIGLSLFKLEDQLTVLGSAELNFDGAHIAQLSRLLCRSRLSAEDAEDIRARTEGWVAGAKLALLSTRDRAHPGESLRQFTGSHSEVVRYLADAVLRDQPGEVREFLILSSVVDKMNGDLCDAVLGITNGQLRLENLERSQLFIQPLDGHRQWYRYHVLFLDFLRACLRRDFAHRLASLHLAASRWFAQHEMYEEALQHAFAAGERDWCVELTAQCARRWFNAGEIAEVLRWAERLSVEEILDNPVVGSAYVGSLILSRRFAQAGMLLRDIEARAGAHAGDKPAIPLNVLNLMLAILSDANDGADGMNDTPIGAQSDDAYLSATLLTVHAYRLLRRQKFDAARRLALRARDVLRDSDNDYARGYSDVVVCLADRAQGDMKAAANNCERMFARVGSHTRNPAWVNAATALAHVRYEQNRLAAAESLCVEALPLLSIASTVENLATAYMTLARVKSISGRLSEAFQLLDYLHSVLESGGQRRYLAQVCYEKIRLCLLQQNRERAYAIAADFSLTQMAASCEWHVPQMYDEPWERFGFAYAALLMHERSYAECGTILETLLGSARRAGYVYRQVTLAAALAVCRWRAGRQQAAFDTLNQGLAMTQTFGFTRGTYDEVSGLQELIAAAMKTGGLRCSLPTKYFRKFRDVFTGLRPASQGDPGHNPAPPLESLTERELDVLKLLSQGLSNQEISLRSQIALSTAKWHLKNVFAKLDVSTRTEAIVRARQLRLID